MNAFLESLVPDMSTPVKIAAQVIGWVGMVLIVLSFQFKKIKFFYLTQAIGNACFTLSFLLIGSYAGAAMNFVGGVRSVLYMWEGNRKKKIYFWGVLAAMAGLSLLSAFTGDSWSAILPFIAQASGTVVMVYGSDKMIRVIQTILISPFWLAYNFISPVVIHGESVQWGQIICECFNIVSAIIFIVRVSKSSKKESNNELK